MAAAVLAAAALLLTSFASWWLLSRHNQQALRELDLRERQFHAQTIGANLSALAERMTEVASSTILATGLVDSAGRETYLQPFLAGIRQVNGIAVQVLFADFEGVEIASNNGVFSDEQRRWLVKNIGSHTAQAQIFSAGPLHELVAMAPLLYPRTRTPEGALLYKVSLDDLRAPGTLRLRWGSADPGQSTPVPVPPVFDSVGFRVDGVPSLAGSGFPLAPQYGLILLIALVIFVAVVLAGVKVAAALTRDLRRLDLFSRQLTRDGLTQERVGVSGSDEVAAVAVSINQMLDRLSEQHQALLREDHKLKALADMLKLADRRKDEFLAMLAHELRNPLAPIMTGAEMLKRVSVGDPRIERTGVIIAQQATHMTRIIDDLLDVSRVTRGLVTLRQELVDFSAVVAVAVDQVRPIVDERRQQLSLALAPGALPVRGDHARLVQVVSNLLHNAAKYTPDGGAIALSVAVSQQQLILTVSDNGSGISSELLPDIFDLFTQGERSSDRRHGGLGLGLALVRSLLEQHGGSVQAHSDGAERGSTFTARLPCLLAEDAPAVVASSRTVLQPKTLRIHVVDDNVDAAQTLATLLEMDGHHVSVSFDGQSTLDLSPAHRPDVFILDIGLPDMDGTELAQRLRSRPDHQCVVLIALTGYGQASDRARSLAAGFDHHLVKPVNYNALCELLRQI